MGIQSSVNALMQQIYTIGAIGAGLREQKKQTKATVAALPSFPERFRKEYNIDAKAPLTKEQERAIKWGIIQEKRTGSIVEPSKALNAAKHMIGENEKRRRILEINTALSNEVASDLAKSRVESRTDSINQTKSNFDEHVASLIRYYGKGSENP